MDETFLNDFRATIARAAERLQALSDEEASRRPAPGKWSPKEIIGHLIDSAANNHARFVRGQLPADPQFSKYDQEGWVRVQRYQDRKWDEIVRLWQAYNEHLAWVVETTDRAALAREFTAPGLDDILWKTLDNGRVPTLGYFMTDYVVHLKHHLRQVLGSAFLPASG
jgi:hypothetical protein